MTRRLLGPITGPIVFFLVAALVFAGLGWVTYSALRVEQAQREAAAQAELGNRLRVVLWQLDSRMLPALGVEDSRPYYHYAPPDPAATPLFVADLPDWMKLHFQLDSTNGWTSPLVLDPATADLVRAAWADVPPRNMSPERARVLDELRTHYPVKKIHDLFAATERSIPADSLSLAAPLVVGDMQAGPAPIGPSQASVGTQAVPTPPLVDPLNNGVPTQLKPEPHLDVVRVLGLELCLRDDKPGENPSSQQAQVPAPPGFTGARGLSQGAGGGTRGGRLTQKDIRDNEKQVTDWLNRAGLIDRAIREAKKAGEFQMPRGQLGNFGQNYLPGIDPRNTANALNKSIDNKGDGKLPTILNPSAPGGSSSSIPPGSSPPGVSGPVGPAIGSPGAAPARDEATKELKGLPGTPRDQNGPAFNYPRSDPEVKGKSPTVVSDSLGRLEARNNILLAYELSRCLTCPSESQLRRILDTATKRWLENAAGSTPMGNTNRSAPCSPAQPDTGLPTEERPHVLPPTAPLTQPVAVHLGSMRPQWVTAPDGSDMLVLVRAAKVDGKLIYQGVIVDWAKLEGELKSVVGELFPQARLVPVKDTSLVYADRAMTALPLQLDPGPEPKLAPAGWTTLRLGLVLAWLAAIIAFAAVGFAGWSLIDLAERRIRFVSAVTHELRTPLTSLRLYLDLLVSGMIQDEEKRREYLGTLAMESDRLHRLIDNVLDFARLEKRKKNSDIQAVRVKDLLDQLGRTWADRVAHDGKELIVVSTLPTEREVNTDAAMVQQIVGNLIDNARKYTREAADNRIWVWAKPGTGNTVVLEVEDRGAGVPAGERKSIFKPFRRGEQAESRAGGAGLGLALAKSWAEVLGASLSYRPADGGTGACFRLELPGNNAGPRNAKSGLAIP